jgi:hypothetical protein
MSHIKSTLESSTFFKALKQNAENQSVLKEEVFSLLSPSLQKEVVAIYQRQKCCYIELSSSYVLVAVKHALNNLGRSYKVLVRRS